MACRGSLAVVLSVVAAVVALADAYLWRRLVVDVGWSPSWSRVLTWATIGLAVATPLAVLAGRVVAPRWSRWWLMPTYVWIGTATLACAALLAVDLVRLVLGAPTPRAGALAVVVFTLVSAAWASVEGRRVRVVRVDVPIARLPRALDGLTIVQLSDLHVGPILGRRFVERVVAMAQALAPDVVAITGDLVDAPVAELAADVAALARLRAPLGCYFVTGNHEFHVDADAWCDHLGRLGVRVLRNARVTLARGDAALELAGIDDDEGAPPELASVLAGRDREVPLVLLAHRPHAIGAAQRHGVDLQLSGHSHGGQLWPLPWLLRLDRFGRPGLRRFGATQRYVSCGTGHSGPPMRLGAPAEITQIVLRCAG